MILNFKDVRKEAKMRELPQLTTIAERLRWARKEKNMSQEDVAQAANLSRFNIRDIEIGRVKQPRNPDAIAKALDVPVAWLMHGHQLNDLDESGIELAQKISRLTSEERQQVANLVDLISKK